MERHAVFAIATIFVTGLLWFSTAPLLSWYEYRMFENERLEAAQKWKKAAIASYRMEFVGGPGGTPFYTPTRVQFQNSELVGATHANTKENLDSAIIKQHPHSVESFHLLIQSIIAERPHKFEVKYHATLGYPTHFAVGYSDFTHDGFSYFVNWLEVDAEDL